LKEKWGKNEEILKEWNGMEKWQEKKNENVATNSS